MKIYPKEGDQLYLRQFTNHYYVDQIKNPYTVISVARDVILVQSCKLTAPVYHCVGNPYLDRPDLEGQRVFFYDTIAEKIEPDPTGNVVALSWHPKRNLWGTAGLKDSDYPQYAIFGEGYKHFPYLD